MVMLVICFCVTFTPVEPITLPLWAFTVAVPNVTAVSKPVLLMVATFVGLVLQVTCDVTSAVLLLPKVPVAVYCWVTPGATEAFEGATCNEVMLVEEGKKPPHPAMVNTKQSASAIRVLKRSRCTDLSYHSLRGRAKLPEPYARDVQRTAAT